MAQRSLSLARRQLQILDDALADRRASEPHDDERFACPKGGEGLAGGGRSRLVRVSAPSDIDACRSDERKGRGEVHAEPGSIISRTGFRPVAAVFS